MIGCRVFGTAGVRGVFNVTQTPEQVYRLALTSAFAFGRGSYGVGWDGRKSSALLARVVAAGLVFCRRSSCPVRVGSDSCDGVRREGGEVQSGLLRHGIA